MLAYRKTQSIALEVAKKVAQKVSVGDSERKIAKMVEDELKKRGCEQYFHKAFVWIGERTVFHGCKTYLSYLPSERKIERENEVVLIDVAPVIDSYPADIGYSFSISENNVLAKMKKDLMIIRNEIPNIFREAKNSSEINERVNLMIKDMDYDNIHKNYPFKVLAHRIYPFQKMPDFVSPFSIQVYLQALSKGFHKQFINEKKHSELLGIWAVEPHIGKGMIGAKFEEMLVVTEREVRWLEEKGFYE